MTKKAFIWLGIRAIGVCWLIKLVFSALSLIAMFASSATVLKIGSVQQSRYSDCYQLTIWLIPSLYFLAALALTFYFLFYGKLVYKIISRFVKSRPEDLSGPTSYCYCEIIVRFIGLWCIGIMTTRLCISLATTLQSFLSFYLTRPEYVKQHPFIAAFGKYFTMGTISLVFYLAIAFFIGWYFLKKGSFFINLLNRLWLKATGQDATPNPINPVNPV